MTCISHKIKVWVCDGFCFFSYDESSSAALEYHHSKEKKMQHAGIKTSGMFTALSKSTTCMAQETDNTVNTLLH